MSHLKWNLAYLITLILVMSSIFQGVLSSARAETESSDYMKSFSSELLKIQPPWSAPIYKGTELTVPGVENVPDIHGDVTDPQLVVFFAGNQYMLVNELMKEFMKANPQYSRVLALTLPPGRLVQAIQEDQGIIIGNMRLKVQPDILTTGKGGMLDLQNTYHWFSTTEEYAQNRLAIMVQKNNPQKITSLQDLAKPEIKLCMPNPRWEGIAKHAIIPALKKVGGEKLVDQIYKEKVKKGMTYETHIHHRETPLHIMMGQCNAGVVWYTEAYFHHEIAHHSTDIVEIPEKENQSVIYMAGQLKRAPHKAAASAFMEFLKGPKSQALYKKYGFMKVSK